MIHQPCHIGGINGSTHMDVCLQDTLYVRHLCSKFPTVHHPLYAMTYSLQNQMLVYSFLKHVYM